MRLDTAKTLGAALLAALLVPALAAAAGAATHRTLVIRPDTLKNVNPADTSPYQQTLVSILGDNKIFWRRVRLPAGATVTGLEVLAMDRGVPFGSVMLLRYRADEGPDACLDPLACLVAVVALAEVDGTPAGSWKRLVDDAPAPLLRRVGKRYEYLLSVQMETGLAVGRMKIRYRVP